MHSPAQPYIVLHCFTTGWKKTNFSKNTHLCKTYIVENNVHFKDTTQSSSQCLHIYSKQHFVEMLHMKYLIQAQ